MKIFHAMSSSSSRTKFEWSPLIASRMRALAKKITRRNEVQSFDSSSNGRFTSRRNRIRTHSYASGILRSEKRLLYVRSISVGTVRIESPGAFEFILRYTASPGWTRMTSSLRVISLKMPCVTSLYWIRISVFCSLRAEKRTRKYRHVSPALETMKGTRSSVCSNLFRP